MHIRGSADHRALRACHEAFRHPLSKLEPLQTLQRAGSSGHAMHPRGSGVFQKSLRSQVQEAFLLSYRAVLALCGSAA